MGCYFCLALPDGGSDVQSKTGFLCRLRQVSRNVGSGDVASFSSIHNYR